MGYLILPKTHSIGARGRDIHGAMFRMKVKKSCGNNNNSGYFLKIALPYISRILMLIFNTSIEISTFPVSWKIA